MGVLKLFDAEKERLKVLSILDEISQDEIKITKSELFKNSINVALDEMDEFEKEFKKFVNNVSHLEVYKEIIHNPLTRDVEKMIKNVRFLIEKNYTKEEKEHMPIEILQQVQASQERRMRLLQNVARRYFSHIKTIKDDK